MTNEMLIEVMKDAYIKVMGFEKWNSLTDEQKHDVIMGLVKDSLKAIENK